MISFPYRVLGEVPYGEALRLQRELVAEIIAQELPGVLLLLEHPPVITLGRGAKREHLLVPEAKLRERGVELYEIERGGDVTYHGPGQIVGYPLLNLRFWQKDVHAFLRALEEVLIEFLRVFGISGFRFPPYTGVWVEKEGPKKIAAIGVAVKQWVTYHGFALNVSPELSFFRYIVPCGIRDFGVTSLREILGRDFSGKERVSMAHLLAQKFGEVFGFAMEEVESEHPSFVD
ncbi:MAG: lipoyl(octanoyl) transferase LipB [Candidatus Caldatribacterium sp.]|nr:lipoyl(octanoyl) transferase LipB [Candidatus Caldatribacterium sp.]